MSTLTLIRMFKLWFFLNCLRLTRRLTTTIQSLTSLYAFMTTQTKCRKQRTSYMLLSKALTLFTHIQPSLNTFFTKPMVRIGQMLTKSLHFAIALILCYKIDLLSNLTSFASTLSLYKLFNSQLATLCLLSFNLSLPLLVINTIASLQT